MKKYNKVCKGYHGHNDGAHEKKFKRRAERREAKRLMKEKKFEQLSPVEKRVYWDYTT